jgi:hypothetical protein
VGTTFLNLYFFPKSNNERTLYEVLGRSGRYDQIQIGLTELRFVPRNDKKLNIFVGTVRPEGFLIRVTWGELGYCGRISRFVIASVAKQSVSSWEENFKLFCTIPPDWFNETPIRTSQ